MPRCEEDRKIGIQAREARLNTNFPAFSCVLTIKKRPCGRFLISGKRHTVVAG
jgi:hypothetical protein